jgi:hypothetical protein
MALIYFDPTIGTIADIIADYCPKTISDLGLPIIPTQNITENNQLSIIVFYCTLGEILLQQFLERFMNFQMIPIKIQSRLLQDNLYAKQRIDNLFPALAGTSWKEVIRKLDKTPNKDHQSVVKFYLEVNEKRNQLLHLGNKWDIPSDMAHNCVENIAPLIQLFIDLHNVYIAKPLPL